MTYLFVGGYWISDAFFFFFLFYFFGGVRRVAILSLSSEVLLISSRNKLAKLVIYTLANNKESL